MFDSSIDTGALRVFKTGTSVYIPVWPKGISDVYPSLSAIGIRNSESLRDNPEESINSIGCVKDVDKAILFYMFNGHPVERIFPTMGKKSDLSWRVISLSLSFLSNLRFHLNFDMIPKIPKNVSVEICFNNQDKMPENYSVKPFKICKTPPHKML